MEEVHTIGEEPQAEAGPAKSVSFSEPVKVVEIPSHHAYTNEMRRNLWNSLDAIQRNLERNTVEFLVDGWDWENATEEEDFWELPRTGELVHPATWMRRCAPRHHPSKHSSKLRRLDEMIQRAHKAVRRHQSSKRILGFLKAQK